jgi:hypothetical protein
MKIYSKFKDYYDSALGSFTESEARFNRSPELCFLSYKDHRELGKNFDGMIGSNRGFMEDHPELFRKDISDKLRLAAQLYSFWIGFCGKYYPFVTPSGSIGDIVRGNSKEAAAKLYPEMIRDGVTWTCEPSTFEDLRKYSSYTLDFMRHCGLKPNSDGDYKNPEECEYWRDEAFEEFGPIFLMIYPVIAYTCRQAEQKAITIVKNPRLQTFGFQKVKDPFTALWEIENWIDSHARPDDAVVPVGDDLVRIKSHGFDPKTSFRRAKREK